MGIYIPRMEMPTDCCTCKLRFATGCCGSLPANMRHPACPLVPVPEHGRLIDADSLCDGLVSNHPVVIHAKCAPTIIPASEEIYGGERREVQKHEDN